MKKEKDDISKLFSSKLKNWEMDVPDAVWNTLSDRLSVQQTPTIAPQEKKRKKILLWTMASVASVLLLLLLLFRWNSNDSLLKIQTQMTSDLCVHPDLSKKKVPTFVKANKGTNFVKSTAKQKKYLTSGSISNNNLPHQKSAHSLSDVFAEIQDTKDSISEPKSSPKNAQPVSEEELNRKTEEFANSAKKETDQLFAENEDKPMKQKEKRRMTLTAGGRLGLASHTMTTNQMVSLSSFSNSSVSNTLTRSSKSTYELDHSLPVSFTMGISKPMSDFLSLEIGLSYSYLYSKQKGTSNATTRQVQQFYYLGLPVALNFRVASWNRFRLGVVAGGSIQKDVVGRMKEEVSSSSYGESSSEKIHQRNFQPSLNANLHISYAIAKSWRLNGKFGGAYYFDTKDNYSTIYSDKNFLPDLGVGLSYEFEY